MSGYALFSEIVQSFSLAPVLDMSQAAAERFEMLRAERVRIGTMDLRIASICLAENFVLLSRNRKDFEQVPELFLEDWTV